MVGQYLPQTNEKCYSVLQDFFSSTVFFPWELNTAPIICGMVLLLQTVCTRSPCQLDALFVLHIQIPLHQGLTEPSCGGPLHSSSCPWSLEFQLQQVDKAHGLMMHALMPISPSDSLHWVFFLNKEEIVRAFLHYGVYLFDTSFLIQGTNHMSTVSA